MVNNLNILAFDTESTTINKGHPFTEGNKLAAISFAWPELYGIEKECLLIETNAGSPYGHAIQTFQNLLNDVDLLVGFNMKRDIHWLRRYGISLPKRISLWDVQSVDFVLCNQKNKFPSLQDVCDTYSIKGKFDYIKENYWDKGIDTLDIPYEELYNYACQDALITFQCFQKQYEQQGSKKTLIENVNADLLILEEMEFNGIIYDIEQSKLAGDKILDQISELDSFLNLSVGDVPVNWDSPEHVSCVLYGGTVVVKRVEPYEHTFKTGKLAGKTLIRNRHFEDTYQLPRLVEPPKNSALAKEGVFATDEKTLEIARNYAKGKGKQCIDTILDRRHLAKKLQTYYHGFPALYDEMGWKDNTLHGQLNQCGAVTGRLSSNSPNLQNIDGEVQKLVKSRYDS